jgi:hypothetical protein
LHLLQGSRKKHNEDYQDEEDDHNETKGAEDELEGNHQECNPTPKKEKDVSFKYASSVHQLPHPSEMDHVPTTQESYLNAKRNDYLQMHPSTSSKYNWNNLPQHISLSEGRYAQPQKTDEKPSTVQISTVFRTCCTKQIIHKII